MEVFSNGKSLGIIELPYTLFDTKSNLYFAFNVYPLNYIKLNTGQKPFMYEPTQTSLAFRKFTYEPMQNIVKYAFNASSDHRF